MSFIDKVIPTPHIADRGENHNDWAGTIFRLWKSCPGTNDSDASPGVLDVGPWPDLAICSIIMIGRSVGIGYKGMSMFHRYCSTTLEEGQQMSCTYTHKARRHLMPNIPDCQNHQAP